MYGILLIKGSDIMEYTIIRSDRKSVTIQITPDGKVLVRCPKGAKNRDIQAVVEAKRDWIESNLREIAARPVMPKLTRPQLKALAQQAADSLPRLAQQYAARAGVTYGRISIRAQRTRWGSCSSEGNLNFNCLLMLAPPQVQAYVVVHELCHRKQMNHSDRFWQEVARVMPDYRIHKQWLKDNGSSLMARLPD